MENIRKLSATPQNDGATPSSQTKPYPVAPPLSLLSASSSSSAVTRKKPITAIAIHAGAGFHSHANEVFHLQACSEYVSQGTYLLEG